MLFGGPDKTVLFLPLPPRVFPYCHSSVPRLRRRPPFCLEDPNNFYPLSLSLSIVGCLEWPPFHPYPSPRLVGKPPRGGRPLLLRKHPSPLADFEPESLGSAPGWSSAAWLPQAVSFLFYLLNPSYVPRFVCLFSIIGCHKCISVRIKDSALCFSFLFAHRFRNLLGFKHFGCRFKAFASLYASTFAFNFFRIQCG